jgi:AraC-like DNA-binding protein/mannose-6-phosphate isomerase-like protein (cupin superfamily)
MALSAIFMYLSDVQRWIPESRAELYWCDTYVCEPDWSWRVRELPNLDLWYVTDGAGWIDGGEGRTPMGTGDCLLLRPGASYRAGHDPERPVSLIAVHFDLVGEGGERLHPPPEELPPFIRQIQRGAFFRELLDRVVGAYRDGSRERAAAWLQSVLMEVIRQDARTRPPGPLGDQARRIQRMCERIRRHPERPVRVEELARELHVTPEHFCRVFRELQGASPRAFITQTRIEAARTLLLTSSHPITRVAEILGYSSPFYFSRRFKAKVGLSPSAFRRVGRERERGQPGG